MSSCHSIVSVVKPLLDMNVFFGFSSQGTGRWGWKDTGQKPKLSAPCSQWGVLHLSAPWYSQPCGLWPLEGKRRNSPGCVSGIWPTLECHHFSLAGVHPQQLFLIQKLISWAVLTFQNWLCHLEVSLVAEFHRHRACSSFCLALSRGMQGGRGFTDTLGRGQMSPSLCVWPEPSETLNTPCWQQSLLRMWHPRTVASSMGRLMAKWVSWVWLLWSWSLRHRTRLRTPGFKSCKRLAAFSPHKRYLITFCQLKIKYMNYKKT